MPEIANPPGGILLLLWPFKGEWNYPQIVGDLNEEYRQRAAEEGSPAALRWYRREILRTLWILIWRPATLGAIVVPLICAALLGFFTGPLLLLSSVLWQGRAPITPAVLVAIVCCNAMMDGFISGAVASRLLPGHERMVRLVLAAFHVGLSGMRVMMIADIPWIPLLLSFGRTFVLTVPFVWIGSVWIERRNRRRIAG
jgi:hypothetical protein